MEVSGHLEEISVEGRGLRGLRNLVHVNQRRGPRSRLVPVHMRQLCGNVNRSHSEAAETERHRLLPSHACSQLHRVRISALESVGATHVSYA